MLLQTEHVSKEFNGIYADDAFSLFEEFFEFINTIFKSDDFSFSSCSIREILFFEFGVFSLEFLLLFEKLFVFCRRLICHMVISLLPLFSINIIS